MVTSSGELPNEKPQLLGSSASQLPAFTIHWSKCPLSDEDGPRALWFLDGAFGIESDIYLGSTMKGLYEDQSCNWFFWTESESRIASICWYITPDDDPSLGCFGEVYTAPEFRGKGLAKELNAFALKHFDDSSGKLMMLATGNPVAAKLYKSLGFQPHPEGFMRRFTPGCNGFLDDYYAPGEMITRQVRYGDMPRVVALLNEPNPWVCAHLPAGIYSANWYRHNRCGSLFSPLWRRTNGLWYGAFNQCGAMVGSVTMESAGSIDSPGHVILDMFVHPAYAEQALRLLGRAISFGKSQGAQSFGAYIAAEDKEKASVLWKEGFERVSACVFDIQPMEASQSAEYWLMR